MILRRRINTCGGDHYGEGHRACMALLAEGLRWAWGIRLSEEALVYTPCGKPVLRDHPEVYFSISHCDGLACCVLTDVPVGIDAERIRAFRPTAARHACSGEELAAIAAARDPSRTFFRFWTLKESCLKAMGTGLSYPLRSLTFRLDAEEATCPSMPEYRFRLWEDDPEYMLAVCTLHH